VATERLLWLVVGDRAVIGPGFGTRLDELRIETAGRCGDPA
jgi:hypothetical protein